MKIFLMQSNCTRTEFLNPYCFGTFNSRGSIERNAFDNPTYFILMQLK